MERWFLPMTHLVLVNARVILECSLYKSYLFIELCVCHEFLS